LSESGYEGDLEDEGEQMMDESIDDTSFLDELSERDNKSNTASCHVQLSEGDSMLNRQQDNSSFLANDENSRSTSTPSILRQKAFFDDGVELMDIEPVAIGNMIDSVNEVFMPVARQPLKEVENNNYVSNTTSKLRPKSSQRRKECPLRTRRISRSRSEL